MAEQPMTRRQRRDAERAAQREREAAVAERGHEPAVQTVDLPPSYKPSSRPPARTAASVTRTHRHYSRESEHDHRPTAEDDAGPSPYLPPSRRHSRIGAVGRAGVLVVLALVTVVAPLSSNLLTSPQAVAASSSSSAEPTEPGTTDSSSSVAAAVLGSDADVDTESDPELSNVPDAATLARIREAYENASATCAVQTAGASGDTAAFNSAPEVFHPMIAGTYTVSSPYGYRLHPTLGYMKLHAGQDYAAPTGTPIYAAASGTVVAAGMDGGTGTVTIKHEIDGEVWYTRYLHMYEDGIYVSEGEKVEAGQLIAGAGSTGYSTGPHLHFEVRTADDTEDSSSVEPEAWLAEHGAAELTTDCS
ncbi:M23 family metallopeptidase [Actinomyces qiguomingii]|uniref:M23 family metallopeptidase n=1 Tax=Actinomyces qiguomingii TaxID=2057800 RepID=UPI001E600DC3|nr:M23 family metallopeptidase [Actinomyces qiguomingii]